MRHERNFMPHIFFIVYDGIHNSVFISQVVTPLIAKLNATPELSITIISFESNSTPLPTIPTHPRLHLKILPRSRFWGSVSLCIDAWRLKQFLSQFDCYKLIARGPLAGWIAIHGKTPQAQSLIIQARGLCAEEYL